MTLLSQIRTLVPGALWVRNKVMASLLRILWGLILIWAVLLVLGAANLVQLCSLVVKSFSPAGYRRINQECAWIFYSFLVWASSTAQGIRVHLSGDTDPPTENALLFCNHRSLADVLYILAFKRRAGALRKARWFVKAPLKWIPGVGWGLWFLGSIFLRRRWTEDRPSIDATFAEILRRKDPVWLGSFVEGTRQTPAKLRLSQEFAARCGLSRLNYLLIPRTKGFVATLSGLQGHLEAVYDLTLAYPRPPSLRAVFFGQIKEVFLHVERTAIADLPQRDLERAAWLHRQFVRKDARLGQFERSHSLDGIKSL